MLACNNIHTGSHQRVSQGRPPPRDHQLDQAAGVSGYVPFTGARLCRWPGGGVRQRGQPPTLPVPHFRRVQAHAPRCPFGVLHQSDHEHPEWDLKQKNRWRRRIRSHAFISSHAKSFNYIPNNVSQQVATYGYQISSIYLADADRFTGGMHVMRSYVPYLSCCWSPYHAIIKEVTSNKVVCLN